MRHATSRLALAALAGAAATALIAFSGAAGIGASAVAAVTAASTRPSTSTPLTPTPSASTVTRPWIPASCATGQFSGMGVDPEGRHTLLGSVTLCGAYRQESAFTLVAFKPTEPRAHAYSYALLPYAPEGSTPFRGVMREAPTSGELGVCVMAGPTAPLACVRLTFAADEPPVMQPIPVTDALVSKPVKYVPSSSPSQDGNPFCGTCV